MRIQSGDKKLLNKKDPLGVVRFGGFEPIDISGCVLWLRSDLGITKDGADKVSAWADQSGNGNDVTQAAGDSQPLWVASQLNGYPSIRFDGANDAMVTAPFVLSQPEDIYLVIKQPSFLHGDSIMDGNAVNSGRVAQLNPSPEIALYAGGAGWVCNTTTGSLNWQLLQSRFNGAASLTRINGGVPVVGDPGAANMGGVSLGATGGIGDFCNIEFSEIIIYSSALSDSNRQLVETYLNGRYAIY
jgi:hypothetical protein